MYFVIIYNAKTGKPTIREFTDQTKVKEFYLGEVGQDADEPWLKVALIEEKNMEMLEKHSQRYFHKVQM